MKACIKNVYMSTKLFYVEPQLTAAFPMYNGARD